MFTVLLRLLAILSVDANHATEIKSFRPQARTSFRIQSVRVDTDTPFCFSVIEERGPVSRALGLGCYAKGPAEMKFSNSIVVAGGAYSVVVFRRADLDPPTTCLVLIKFDKEKIK